ncbi:hypothetical protein ACFQ3K_14325 [Brucella gallinifaecis]|uniref:Organic solvent tolerance-like N-terminal domain-containing protein n=1 Tax=Brucella gallinifaecis TaxID=215590 RepID=A0A502BR10_9HYPH|nr:hypothetical protein [Brucella gallinifaecis]TPF76644.1 hypothetical protein FHY56_03900 [Brucella gallinifaecis]
MFSKTSLVFAGLVMCSVVSGANAEAQKPVFKMSGDQFKRISNTTTLINGNAVIEMGKTEIKADKAKVVLNKNKVTVYTDTIVATGKK